MNEIEEYFSLHMDPHVFFFVGSHVAVHYGQGQGDAQCK